MSSPKKISSKPQKKIFLQKKRRVVQPTPIQQPRWKPLELVGVLTFLNDNINTWHDNHHDACEKAIRATNINRDDKALYSKIRTMMKDMDDYLKTDVKSTSNALIWEDKKIYDLVKKMYDKTKERKEEETLTRTGDGDTEMTMNDDQVTETSTTSTTSTSRIQVPLSIEAVRNLYIEKCQQVDQLRAKITEKIEDANNTFEESNVQIFYSTERANNICNERIQKLDQLKSELIELIESANDKYEEMKNF